jgi:hypothetical protein
MDLFINTVGINPIFGMEQAGATMRDEFVGNPDPKNPIGLELLFFQQFHDRASKTPH